ncbi:xanthine dehydrogenase family protein molybdopterin-binding subunit [Rubellimicrobium rubrum]|uniref:Xanthine dehydrogenase family protein molybdopterin-binding subunit n=1 Tax=Rubellimicrobium rubrum TaxID=2585369 RepID=A0A5C4MT54_9RHOB|nr:xanthine dehydrogenase family protein molybdopterin-binding subunit [Rubellimicrobium rubrum]TNC47624.1 xanthine dehydrogenase family protein molybdopterin-binding subunit [Rubellimicrobium rubrum]
MRAAQITNVSRRSLLGGIGAGAFVLAVGLPSTGRAQEEEPGFGPDAMPNGWRDDPSTFIAIAPDGTVTVTCHRSEMGQGVRTSIAMVIADELGADWDKVRVAQAPGNEEKYGNQDTDGSRSLRHFFMPMRRAGAAARVMLEQAAASRWGVPVSEVSADRHTVTHAGSGRTLGYGELAEAARDLEVPERDSLVLKDPSAFRYIGTDRVGLVDNSGITTGKATYGIDVRRDGMLYAVVARPPVYGGRVKSYDDSAALAIEGVEKVVKIDPVEFPTEFAPLGGIAVIARNTYLAIQGRNALTVEWESGPNAGYDSETYRETLSQAVSSASGTVIREQGDFDKAFAGAAQVVEAEYYIPHLAQAPMEPPAAVVEIRDGLVEAWACTQAPQVTRLRLAERLGLPAEAVTVNVTLLGGGFGRKSKPDFVLEAGILSQAMGGTPVKLTWTREDDIQHGYYHTVSVERMSAGLDATGKTMAWRHRTAAPTIGSIFAPDPTQKLPFELGMGLLNMPLAIENIRAENPAAPAHVRIGWYRSVSNIPHAFAIQSFAAELAHAAGRDQKDYLLELIGPPRRVTPTVQGDVWNYGEDPDLYLIDTGRMAAVVEAAAEGIEWGREMTQGRGLGIAGHYSFLSYVAVAAEAEVVDGAVTVPRVSIAIDCGAHVNPDRIRSQMEGAVIMGLGQALMTEVSFAEGRAQQENFDGYLIPRMENAPKRIDVHLVGGDATYGRPLGGVGEPGLPPVVPAITNAVFAASGKRIRRLPIADQLRS